MFHLTGAFPFGVPMLTIERLKQKLIYNAETGEFTWRKGRGPVKAGSIAGRPHNKGYLRISVDYKDYLAHRLAWLYVHGEWPQDEIDHINGIKTDNRLCNLRQANREGNCRNVPVHKRNKLGIKGVSMRTDCKKPFSARIMVSGKVILLGRFDTPEDAKAAYDLAAIKYFGEFSRK